MKWKTCIKCFNQKKSNSSPKKGITNYIVVVNLVDNRINTKIRDIFKDKYIAYIHHGIDIINGSLNHVSKIYNLIVIYSC